MNKMNTEQLRQKIVINLCDGAKLGYVVELEFDVCDGRICAVVVAKDCGFFAFGKNERAVVPWDRIDRIGEDAILVRVPPEELVCRPPKKDRR